MPHVIAGGTNGGCRYTGADGAVERAFVGGVDNGILYDLQGRSAMQILIEPGYQSIDVSSVAPGLYVLRAGSATFKIKL